MEAALIGVLLTIAVVLFVYVASGVRIVRPYQRAVIEQLGRYKETVDPGLRLIYPFVQRLRAVDMREQVIDVPPQEVITEDNVTVSVDAVIYFEPTDPQRLLYNVGNFILAITKLAQTNLRNVIGEMSLDEAFTSRERVNAALRSILDDATDKWGVRVVRVEIQRIDPPHDVMSAMHEQMRAERTRRAVVTEAEGARSAAITRAEGEKQAAILTAEGQRQQEILNAEGDAQAVRLRAEAEQYRQQVVALGEADAINTVFRAIRDAGTDDRVIAIKYLEALQGIADGRATKIFLPADMSAVMGSIGGIAELFNAGGPNAGGPDGGGPDGGEPAEGADRRQAPTARPSPGPAARPTGRPSPPSGPSLPPPPAQPPPSRR
jgi:regulator of protease activity HflC (stomatin/prohibitin superfamily)